MAQSKRDKAIAIAMKKRNVVGKFSQRHAVVNNGQGKTTEFISSQRRPSSIPCPECKTGQLKAKEIGVMRHRIRRCSNKNCFNEFPVSMNPQTEAKQLRELRR